jgi:protein-tyrosine phosphatase
MGRTEYFPAVEIRPGLWIGSQGDSESAAFMAEHNIGLVVNCTRNISTETARRAGDIEVIRIGVDDSPVESQKMLDAWPAVVRTIDAVLSRGKGVLVHCRAGMQRSAATVAAYLMYKEGLGAENAQESIRKLKPETFWPKATFGKALKAYENSRNLRTTSTTFAER